jgi:hypothetical protein
MKVLFAFTTLLAALPAASGAYSFERRAQDNVVCYGPDLSRRLQKTVPKEKNVPKGSRRNLREVSAHSKEALVTLRGGRHLQSEPRMSSKDSKGSSKGIGGDDDDDDGGSGICNIECKPFETCFCIEKCDGGDDVSIVRVRIHKLTE